MTEISNDKKLMLLTSVTNHLLYEQVKKRAVTSTNRLCHTNNKQEKGQIVKNNTKVRFEVGGVSYTGLVKGLATTKQPVMEHLVIILLDDKLPGYEFECIVMPETLLTVEN